MGLALDRKLKIRSMVYVAGEPIPYFWPMRNFIHHNPLHGLEKLPFAQAVEKGQALFHGKGFLPRKTYQRFLQEGKIDRASLLTGVQDFVATRSSVPGVDLTHWLMTLLTQIAEPLSQACFVAGTHDVHHALNGKVSECAAPVDMAALAAWLHEKVGGARPIYEAVDTLFGTHIGTTLDDLLIKSCLDFFDEGQSAWTMPGRESGLFNAWRELSRRNVRFFLRGVNISQILAQSSTPEGVISNVMDTGRTIFHASWCACMVGPVSSAGVQTPNITTGDSIIRPTWLIFWQYGWRLDWPCLKRKLVRMCPAVRLNWRSS
jgi:uncharacterized protein YbcC (UPF0753/DUF2309 family)